MIRKIRRAGALASAAVLFACVSGTALSGALAQDLTGIAQSDTTATALRFVAEPVVQTLPQTDQEPTPEASSLAALVADPSLARGEISRELNCLAQAVYFEARGEALNGQLAVAEVIINRAESEVFPGDYCSVVTQRGQFSFVRGGRIPSAPTSSQAWHRARAIALIAHNDLWDSGVGESLYFHNASVSPGWARRKARVARIDSHLFYQ